MLVLIAEQLTKLLGASGCSISRWDREADVIITWIDWRKNPDDWSSEANEIFELKEFPTTREVLLDCQPLSIKVSDPAADPMEVDYLRKNETASLLLLPLSDGEQVIGLVELDDEKDREFTPEEIRF